MSASKEFEAVIRQQYGNLKTVKSFIDCVVKAYDDNLDGLLKFLDDDDAILEQNMLRELNEESVAESVENYSINPEILIRLLTKLGDTLVEPLVEGYYDNTNDFGQVSNSEFKKKKKTKVKKTKNARPKVRAQSNELQQSATSTTTSSSLKNGDHERGRRTSKKTSSNASDKKAIKRSKSSTPATAKTPTKTKTKTSTAADRPTVSTSATVSGDNAVDAVQTFLDDFHSRLAECTPGPSTPQSLLTLPVVWRCVYYHQMGADLEFEIVDDVHDQQEKSDVLWKAWQEHTLRAVRTEYDSDDNDENGDEHKNHKNNGDDDEDALLTQVPDFVYDFHSHAQEHTNFKVNDSHAFFAYRVRRWISHDLQTDEAKQVTARFADAPAYSWRADAVSYLADYVLSDDLVVVQDASLLGAPTRWKWLAHEHLHFIRDSGFFGARDQRGGIHALSPSQNDDDAKQPDVLRDGVCVVGDFKIGMQPNEEQLDLYGIVRVDVLSPAVLRFPFYRSMRNVATPTKTTAAAAAEVVSAQLECRLPMVQKYALRFDNESESDEVKQDTAMKVDLQPLLEQSRVSSDHDCWTMFLCFSHPHAKPKGEKSTLLFKKNCLKLHIENAYEEATQTLIKEELVLKIFSKNKGSRFVEIFRKKIVSNQAQHVNMLIVAYNGTDKKLFASLNGRQLSLIEHELNRTNLFNLKKTRFLLLGHKCAAGDTGATQNVFNGCLMQFALYPTVFREFELRAFQQQCGAHIEQFCD